MTKLINLSSLEAELLAVKESIKELNANRKVHLRIAANFRKDIKALELTVENCEKVLHQWVNEPTLPVSEEEKND